jgi:hypothetical protein
VLSSSFFFSFFFFFFFLNFLFCDSGTPLSQTVDEGIILQLSNFALAGPADGVTQVVIESEGDSYVIANLSWPGHAQFSSDIAFSDQDVKISVKGKGEVHVTGTFSIDSMMDDSDEMGDSDLMAEYPSGSSDSEGEGYPAHVGSKRVELLDEDGGSDSSDSSAEKAIQAAAAKAAQGKPQQGKPQQQQQQQGKPQQQQGKPQQQQGKPQQQQGGKVQEIGKSIKCTVLMFCLC